MATLHKGICTIMFLQQNDITITLITVLFTSIIYKWYFTSVHIVCDKVTKQRWTQQSLEYIRGEKNSFAKHVQIWLEIMFTLYICYSLLVWEKF